MSDEGRAAGRGTRSQRAILGSSTTRCQSSRAPFRPACLAPHGLQNETVILSEAKDLGLSGQRLYVLALAHVMETAVPGRYTPDGPLA